MQFLKRRCPHKPVMRTERKDGSGRVRRMRRMRRVGPIFPEFRPESEAAHQPPPRQYDHTETLRSAFYRYTAAMSEVFDDVCAWFYTMLPAMYAEIAKGSGCEQYCTILCVAIGMGRQARSPKETSLSSSICDYIPVLTALAMHAVCHPFSPPSVVAHSNPQTNFGMTTSDLVTRAFGCRGRCRCRCRLPLPSSLPMLLPMPMPMPMPLCP